MTLRKIIGLKLGAFRFIVHTKELSHLSLDHALVEDTTAVCFYVEINSMQNCWWFILWEVSIYVSSCTKIIIIWRAMMTDPEAPLTQTEEENQTTWFFESHLKLSPFFKVGTQSVFFFFFLLKRNAELRGPKQASIQTILGTQSYTCNPCQMECMEINSREKEESYEIRNLKLGCIMHGLWKRQWDYSKHLYFLCSGHSIPEERVKEMGLVGNVGKTDKFLGLECLPEIMKLQWTRVCWERLFLKLGWLISDWLMWAHLEKIKLGGGWKCGDCEDWEWQILVLKRI